MELLMQEEAYLPVANLPFLNVGGLTCSTLTAKNQPPTAAALLYPSVGGDRLRHVLGRAGICLPPTPP